MVLVAQLCFNFGLVSLTSRSDSLFLRSDNGPYAVDTVSNLFHDRSQLLQLFSCAAHLIANKFQQDNHHNNRNRKQHFEQFVVHRSAHFFVMNSVEFTRLQYTSSSASVRLPTFTK